MSLRSTKVMVSPSRQAKLMIWKNPHGVWNLTLWVPFHGQWILASHVRRPMFERKANQIIGAMGLPVEEVDSIPAAKRK